VPLVERLDHSSLTVSSLERSLAFYGELLGCEVVSVRERHGGPTARIVGYPDVHLRIADLRAPSGGHVIELIEYREPPGISVPIEPRLIGAAHLCFVVGDLGAVYEALRAAGVDSFVSPPVGIGEEAGGGRALYLRDPDGIIVELVEAGFPG
jgi:catechol 2,3-dioxygenase-like lactoylglutathione lyase family enzyme